MKYRYIFFDLDGTLTDPAAGICESVRYALTRAGYPAGPREEYHSFIGPPLRLSFRRHLGVSDEEAKRLLGLYRERFSTTGLFENEVYPGIPELLAELKANGARLVVATGKPTVYSTRILEHFNLLPYFDYVSGISLTDEPLDKKGVIEAGCAALGIGDKAECVMVGDRGQDVDGAKKAGMDCISVLYGYGTAEECAGAGATLLAATVEELRNLLLA